MLVNFFTHLWSLFRSIVGILLPRPHTGSIWRDICYLVVVIVLQLTVLPSLLGFSVDLLTPWLAYAAVVQSTPVTMVLTLLASVWVENHTTVPAGLYICAYWIMVTLIIMVRNHISWFNVLPWLSTFFVCQVWLLIFESFVYLVKTSHFAHFDLWLLLSFLLRIVGSVLVGLWIVNYNFGRSVEER